LTRGKLPGGWVGEIQVRRIVLTGKIRSFPLIVLSLAIFSGAHFDSPKDKFMQLTIRLLLITMLLAACAPKSTLTPNASPGISPTSQSTPLPPTATPLGEGPVLLGKMGTLYIGGTIYGHGKTAVILASRGGYSQYEWSTLAITLANDGYTALTLGSSDGEGTTVIYVQYAIELLRANGFKRIVCIGASNGASGCAYNAHQPELIALVLFTYHGSADLTDITYPKMFIAGESSGYKNSTEKGYNAAAESKTLVIVPGSSETGSSIIDTPGTDLHNRLLDFLKSVTSQ
jgi:hypothetical protein